MGKKVITLPIHTRDNNHDLLQIGNAQYNENRGTLTFRVDLDVFNENLEFLGGAIQLGLLEGFLLNPVVSDLGFQTVADSMTEEEAELADAMTTEGENHD